jgi:hypothetical protein
MCVVGMVDDPLDAMNKLDRLTVFVGDQLQRLAPTSIEHRPLRAGISRLTGRGGRKDGADQQKDGTEEEPKTRPNHPLDSTKRHKT